MKMMLSYAFSQLRSNKKGSALIFASLSVAAMLCTALVGVLVAAWQFQVSEAESQAGNWHGLLLEPIVLSDVPLAQQNPGVDAVMLRGSNRFAQLPEGSGRLYLALQEMDEEAWRSLNTKNDLVEGRLPERPGEILVSRGFFDENPEWSIGDSLTLATGQRAVAGEPLAFSSVYQENEALQPTGEETLTIVGTVSLLSPSSFPCYYSYGWLDAGSLPADAELTLMFRANEPRNTEAVVASILQGLGREAKIENYVLNEGLLSLYGVSSNEGLSGLVIAGILGAFAVCMLFAAIIYNGFAITAESQLRQMGVLKSVGATPQQVRRAVVFQAVLLAIPAIPVGILAGVGVFAILQRLLSSLSSNTLMRQTIWLPWWCWLSIAIVTLLTALAASFGPARRLAKLTPIEAVRGTGRGGVTMKPKQHRFMRRVAGIRGELAAGDLRAHRRSYRSAVVCLALALVLTGGVLVFINTWEEDQVRQSTAGDYNISLSLRIASTPPAGLLEDIESLDGVEEYISYRTNFPYIEKTAVEFHPDYAAIGGVVVPETDFLDENWITIIVMGLDEDSFGEYCQRNGIDASSFEDPAVHPAIAVNNPIGNFQTLIDKHQLEPVPYLDIEPGNVLVTDEFGPNSGEGEAGSILIQAMSMELPRFGSIYPNYLLMLMPEDAYLEYAQNLEPEHIFSAMSLHVSLYSNDEAGTAASIRELLSLYGIQESDFELSTELDWLAEVQENGQFMRNICVALAGFFACIGFASAFSAVSGSLAARRKQFAVLRSVGLTPDGLTKMLFLEALLFALTPLLWAIPFILVFMVFLSQRVANFMSFADVLAVTPWGIIAVAAGFVIASILVGYAYSGNKLRKGTIIEGIRDDTF